MNLTRTKIDIIPESIKPREHVPPIYLPSYRNPFFHYELSLVKLSSKYETCCYSLRTIQGDPYLLNGQVVRESLIEKDDIVYIGNNKLQFKDKNYYQNAILINNHPCLTQSNIIESTLPIYIEGETGCGKSRLAQQIHQKSKNGGKFIHLNLSAFSISLIESELFGHMKGAFTGAHHDKIGALEEADRGTLFLDEIDSLPLEIQTKLLLFLDEQKVRRVGCTKDKKISTRLIFSSGQSLKRLLDKGKIRKDFYFRITSSYSVCLSPLRSSPELVKNFCLSYGIEHNVSLTDRLLDFYLTLPWPGNYRQLKGHLDCKRTTAKNSKLDFDEFDERLMVESTNLRELVPNEDWLTLEEIKSSYIRKALAYFKGNMNLTARTLNISPRTISRLLISEKVGKQS